MFFSDEQIERANGQGITEYFRRNGYSCDREGREMHIHGFGGLKVREDTQEYYIHSRHIGGRGLVSCLMNTFGMSFADAVRTALDGEQPAAEYASERKILPKRNVSASERKKELVIPKRAVNNKRIFAYLSKERCISPFIISELIRSGKLYQDDKGNAVFLHHRDNAPCGAEIHGTGRKKYVIGNRKYDEIAEKRIASVAPFEAEMLSRFLEKADVDYTGYVYSDEANIIAENENFRIVTDVIDLISDERFNTSDINRDISKKLKNFKGVSQGSLGFFCACYELPFQFFNRLKSKR